jgi:hypothetical protein
VERALPSGTRRQKEPAEVDDAAGLRRRVSPSSKRRTGKLSQTGQRLTLFARRTLALQDLSSPDSHLAERVWGDQLAPPEVRQHLETTVAMDPPIASRKRKQFVRLSSQPGI